ncbi:hypothetical protein V5F40_22755 [Xanthobacter sp. DSM 14520]|uniref:hypothetical protein n=1 Tax=Xanthobacter autotrophicus (strain ATCC BAA-1158 / Py2) TaxID=78245 RepID=UPI00372C3B42
MRMELGAVLADDLPVGETASLGQFLAAAASPKPGATQGIVGCGVRSLKLASSMPEFYAIAGRDAARRGDGFGCLCAKCGREIAAPFGFERQLIWCLYCGLEAGYLVEIERPIGCHRWTFGITRAEAVEERSALERGEFEDAIERRARRLDQDA